MKKYDLMIIGTGSGNSLLGPEFKDKKIALVEKGVFGGTCLNVGCIPTKMFVYTAELAAVPSISARFGITETLEGVDWPAIRDRIFGRIDPIAESGKEYRLNHADNENVDVYLGEGRFVGPKTLEVNGETIQADSVVIAAGARPAMPPINGLAETNPLTSDNIMRLEELPESLLILGSGFIAAEMATIFSELGVDVTLVARSEALLRKEDAAVSERITELLAQQVNLVTNFSTKEVSKTANGYVLTGETEAGVQTLTAEELLVATGRIPNSDRLNVAAAGIDQHSDNRIVVDEYQRVIGDGKVLDGVWALGDICSDYQLKHVANQEARTVKHNLLNPDQMWVADHRYVPHAVFTHPQIAAVGLTQQQAEESGRDFVVAVQEYASIAYGWAMEDTTGFMKLIVDKNTTEILGAHIIGPQAPTLIQPIIQAMSTGQKAIDIARTQYWIHPAMPELVENALLQAIEKSNVQL